MGCNTPEPPAPFLAFGTGERTFEALTDGDDGVVIQGPQGGHHLLGSIQVAGVVPGTDGDLSDPDNPTTAFTVSRGDEELSAFTYAQGLAESGTFGVYQLMGRLLVLNINDDTDVLGDTLSVHVDVTDADGVTLSADVDLFAVPAPTNN